MRKIFLIFLILISAPSSAAFKASALKLNYNKHKTELSNITKQIFALEKSLSRGNKRYLRTLKKRKKTEQFIFTLENNLKNEKRLVQKREISTSRKLKQVLVQALNKEMTPAQILGHRYVSKLLKKELQELNKIKTNNLLLDKKLIKTKFEYRELRTIESDLLSLMQEMEDTKKQNSVRYVKLNKKSNELKIKLKLKKHKRSSKKLKKVAKALMKERFSRPLKEVIDIEYGKKGVTFKFNSKQNVLNSRAGKVIHTGSLSTYGNVVMVDHGNNIKSIFLGQFLPIVKKGQSLTRGAVIGNTFDIKKNEGKLYFEVRKKNKPQNTALLLHKKITTKNNQGRRRI